MTAAAFGQEHGRIRGNRAMTEGAGRAVRGACEVWTNGCGEQQQARATPLAASELRAEERPARTAVAASGVAPVAGRDKGPSAMAKITRAPSTRPSPAMSQCPKRTPRAMPLAAPDLLPPPEGR